MKAERTSVKVVLDPRRIKNDNTIPLKLRVTYKGMRKYYVTSHSVTEAQWAFMNTSEVKGKLRTIRNEISKAERDAETVIGRIAPFSFKQFESEYFEKPVGRSSISEMFEELIVELKRNNQLGTAIVYKNSRASLLKFKKDIAISDITPTFLQDYEKWMLQNSRSKATIGMYSRALRSITNIAISKGCMRKEDYPFGNRKYIVPVGRNLKKALDLPNIQKIFEYETVNGSSIDKAKDFWVFSYLCNGINMMDIAKLKWGNLTSSTITFERQKTSKTNHGNTPKIVALRSDHINRIIEKWGNENTDKNSYVFKIIDDKDKPERVSKKIKQFTKNTNKWMKRMGVDLCFELTLTTYVARHSFATILLRNNTPIPFIKQSLGHSKITTTQLYLADFGLDAQHEYRKALTNFK